MLGLTVHATNTDGNSVSGSFMAFIQPAAPTVGAATPTQNLTDGTAFSANLSAAFSDPQHSALSFTAAEISGPDVTSWLNITAAGVLSGIPPLPAGTGVTGIRVTATDTYGLSATETFGVNYAPTVGHAVSSFSNATAASEMLTLHHA